MTITQGVHDYYKNEHTRELLFQSAYWILGPQKPESLNMLRQEKQIVISDHEFDLITGLKTIQGQYSEMFLFTPFGRGISRLRVPGEHYWIYTTKADEVARRTELIKQYGIEKGIQKCVELYS
jgi:conjugal transfer ATP-binding protein TraC